MDQPVPTLHAEQLSKTFSIPTVFEVLKGVDLEAYPGEAIAIMGASGEGKSTLLQILGTLEAPSSGTLTICGQPTHKGNTAALRNRHIGFVFQGFFLLEDLTALDNVLMPAKIARKRVGTTSAMRKHALELLDQVGLSHRAHYLTRLLSGGEKQRVAIARALCNDPDLVLADEPSGNLDHKTSQDIHHLLVDLVAGRGKTLITVTHDRELAQLCHRRYTLQDGALYGEC